MKGILHFNKWAGLIGVALMAACLASCMRSKKASDADEGTPEVSVALPQVDSVTLTKTYPGYLMANRKVDLVARVSGYLRAKCYESGQFVKAGTVLFRIEDTQYRDAVSQAESSLATARSTYDYDSRNYEAMKKALESDAVSQISVIQAESALKNSQAAIKTSEAALQTARTNLGYCTVTAPFDGHVSASGPDVGAYLAGAASPITLATIYEDAVMMANFNVEDAEFIKNIQQNAQAAHLDLNALPVSFEDVLPHTYTGKLSYIAPDVDSSTGTIVLRATINNTYGELKDGMYATVTLPYEILPNAILVRDASISTDQAGKFVYVVNDSNRVVYTPIEVSELANDSMRVVTKGLKPTDRYVTQALLKVRDGMTVKPVTAK